MDNTPRFDLAVNLDFEQRLRYLDSITSGRCPLAPLVLPSLPVQVVYQVDYYDANCPPLSCQASKTPAIECGASALPKPSAAR